MSRAKGKRWTNPFVYGNLSFISLFRDTPLICAYASQFYLENRRSCLSYPAAALTTVGAGYRRKANASILSNPGRLCSIRPAASGQGLVITQCCRYPGPQPYHGTSGASPPDRQSPIPLRPSREITGLISLGITATSILLDLSQLLIGRLSSRVLVHVLYAWRRCLRAFQSQAMSMANTTVLGDAIPLPTTLDT